MNFVLLQLPFINQQTTDEIKRKIKQSGLPFRLISTPGMSLKKLFVKSRPLDNPICPRKTCQTCSRSTKPGNCMTSNIIYSMKCQNCPLTPNGEHPQYIGETNRSLHERFTEHLNNAKNPNAKSYEHKTMAKHFRECHPTETPKLDINILTKYSKTITRKVQEALLINRNNPELNAKSECLAAKQFLI